jgi:type I restriction enzyme S subunit
MLRTPQYRAYCAGRITGSASASFSRDDFLNYRFPAPSPSRIRVVETLGAVDDKIELNRRLSETLEATARTLFRAWFVDFDSPQASGADDWTRGALGDLADLNPEVWPTGDRPSVLRYIDLSGTKWGTIKAVTDYPADEAPSRAQRILRPGDTIVGTVRPGNGSYALVTQDGLTGSTGFAQLRPKRPRDAAFVYLAATARANIDALAHLADGGAYPAVRPALVAATPVIVPDDRTLQAFSVVASPLLERAALAVDESETLGAMRDALLPRLLSGDFEAAA